MTLHAEREAAVPRNEIRWRFRSELRIYDPQPGDRDCRHIVYDPVTDLSYALGKRELMIARLFDGSRTMEEVSAGVARDWRVEAPGKQIELLRNRLAKYGLLEGEAAGSRQRPRDPAVGISYGPLKSVLMIPVLRIEPEALLEFLYRRLSWLCTPFFVIAGVVAMALVAVVFWSNRNAFLADAIRIYGDGPGWLLWHYPVVVVSIFFHEVGHALACRHYRVRVTDFGIAVYLLLATGWARPLQRDWEAIRRGQRLVAIAMGPYASVAFASVGVLLWRWGAEPMVRTAGLVMAVSSTAALLPTLLPMFNGDTYLAICEMVGVPRLRQQSFNYFKSIFLGKPSGECLSARRRLLYATVVAGVLAGWLAVWILLVQLVMIVLPLLGLPRLVPAA